MPRALKISAEENESLPARRHHADRLRGPARTEAAAVIAAAIKSRMAPAVAGVAVVVPVAPLALGTRVGADDGQAIGFRELRPIAGKKSVAMPQPLRAHRYFRPLVG